MVMANSHSYQDKVDRKGGDRHLLHSPFHAGTCAEQRHDVIHVFGLFRLAVLTHGISTHLQLSYFPPSTSVATSVCRWSIFVISTRDDARVLFAVASCRSVLRTARLVAGRRCLHSHFSSVPLRDRQVARAIHFGLYSGTGGQRHWRLEPARPALSKSSH